MRERIEETIKKLKQDQRQLQETFRAIGYQIGILEAVLKDEVKPKTEGANNADAKKTD